MVIIGPWADSLNIIALQTALFFLGITPMGLSAPRADYLEIVALQKVKQTAGY